MRIPCRGRLTLLVLLTLVAGACSRRRTAGGPVPDVTPRRTLPADSVFILRLESSGEPPPDTTVHVGAAGRVVVLRHPGEVQAAFAVIEFGDSAFTGTAEADVAFHARPGAFALEITSTSPIRDGTITFKYARHFAAPPEAVARYGRDARFEHRLVVARDKGDGTIELLPTRRPAADNVSARLEGAGTYLVAGPL